jgi:predicted transcriptional regulator
MTLTLKLTPEIEAKLRELSLATGRLPEELALDAIEQNLVEEPSSPAIPYEEWARLFDEWLSEQVSRNPNFDDSRESIYPDRV